MKPVLTSFFVVLFMVAMVGNAMGGLETDFMVATPEELQAAFPTWVPPEAKQTKDGVWASSRPFPKTNKSAREIFAAQLAAVKKFPHAQYKGVDPVKLNQLQSILAPGKKFCLESRPALLEVAVAKDADEWLVVLTGDFVKALGGIKKEETRSIADKFSKSSEIKWSPEDCASVIQTLSDLARKAAAENKKMYLWMRN